jgi:DNA polymerase-3 subunit epsilon
MEKMHNITWVNMVDLAGRMVFNDNGEEIFNFGKHKGKSVLEVLSIEPMYYDWIQKNDFALDTKRKLTEIKLRQFKR